MQTILEAKVEYKSNQLHRIIVLVEMSRNDVRAIFATKQPRPGYMNIEPDATLSDDLLQQVADYGLETVDRDDIFKNWKSKYRNGYYNQ